MSRATTPQPPAQAYGAGTVFPAYNTAASYPSFVPLGRALTLHIGYAVAGLMDALRWDAVVRHIVQLVSWSFSYMSLADPWCNRDSEIRANGASTRARVSRYAAQRVAHAASTSCQECHSQRALRRFCLCLGVASCPSVARTEPAACVMGFPSFVACAACRMLALLQRTYLDC